METFEKIWYFPLIRLSDGGALTVSQLLLAAALLVAGVIISRFIERAMGRSLAARKVGPDAVQTLQRVVFYTVMIIAAITALGVLRIPITGLAFTTGAIAIGVGFGAQNIINNFISGWILMSERPVRIGDLIEVDGAVGVVERIGNRSTRIRRVDGVHLLVPNSQMLERVVVNWTLIDHSIRAMVSVGVAYGSPVRQVETLIHQVVGEQPEIKKDPAPIVVFEDFGDNALIFQAYFWADVGSSMQVRRICSAIRFRIDELFAEHGIVIAFPQRDLHFDADRPLTVLMKRGDAAAGAEAGRAG